MMYDEKINDPVLTGRFVYERRLIKPSPRPGQGLRRIKIEVHGSRPFVLRYADIHLALRGLLAYGELWDTGNKRDLARTCDFRAYFWKEGGLFQYMLGSVTLIIPPTPSVAAVAAS